MGAGVVILSSGRRRPTQRIVRPSHVHVRIMGRSSGITHVSPVVEWGGVEMCTRDVSEEHLSGCLLSLCCVHWDTCLSKGQPEIPPRSRSGVYDTATITFGRTQMRLCSLRARRFLGELILSD